MRLRQSIEGDIIITLESIDSGMCFLDENGNYISYGLSLIHNDVEYPVQSINGYANGYLAFVLPSGLYLRGGDEIRVISKCDTQETVVQSVLSIDFTATDIPSTITTCSGRPSVSVSFKDIIRLFLNQGTGGYFTLNLNGNGLGVDDFSNQPDYTGIVTSPAGVFTPDAVENVVMFSNDLYPINNTLQIVPTSDSSYFTIRLGFLEIIFDNGTLTVNNYASGIFNQTIGDYSGGQTITISSSKFSYVIDDGLEELYSATKTIRLIGGDNSGSASPTLIGIGDSSVWNFSRTYEGKQTLVAEIGDNMRVGFEMNVVSCIVDPTDHTYTANKGDVNRPINPLTVTGDDICGIGGFQFASIPSCLTLKVNGVIANTGVIFGWDNRDKITYDVSSSCATGSLVVEYGVITSTQGCYSPDNGTITITTSNCPEQWVRTGNFRCFNCDYQVEEIDINVSCSGSEGTRWVNSSEGTCDTEIWEDTGISKCEDCVNLKEQRQTNPCVSIPNRWVSGGNVCNYEPDWVEGADTFCVDCQEMMYAEDMNPCSPTFGKVQVKPNPNGNNCNTIQDWTPTGKTKCIDFKEYYEVIDNNRCSPTFGKNDWKEDLVRNRCKEECDDALFVEAICEDQCHDNEQLARVVGFNVPCNISFNVTILTSDKYILSVSGNNAPLEYSNDGFSWTIIPVFDIRDRGVDVKVYARVKDNPSCLIETKVSIPEQPIVDDPFVPVFPPVYRCVGGFEEMKSLNSVGMEQWTKTGNVCDVCQPNFQDVVPTVTRCRNGFVEKRQFDGCESYRYVPTNQLCQEEGCIPNWVDKVGEPPICMSGVKHKYVVDGCGNEKLVNTGELCSDCISPTFTLQKIDPTCNKDVIGQSLLDGVVSIKSIANADRYQYLTGMAGKSDFSYGLATPIANGQTLISLPVYGFNIGESTKIFTVALFNGDNDCIAVKSIAVSNPCNTKTCIDPSFVNSVAVKATCSPSGAINNDASIGITGITNATKYGISTGASYYGVDCVGATSISNGQLSITNLSGANYVTQYTLRLFNGCDCWKDFVINIPAATCQPIETCNTYIVKSGLNPIQVRVIECSNEEVVHELEPYRTIEVCSVSANKITLIGAGGTVELKGTGCESCREGGIDISYALECPLTSPSEEMALSLSGTTFDGSQVRITIVIYDTVKYTAVHNSGEVHRYVIPEPDQGADELFIRVERNDNSLCFLEETLLLNTMCLCDANPSGTVTYNCTPNGLVPVTITPSIFGGVQARIVVKDASNTEVLNTLSTNGVSVTVNLERGAPYTVRVEHEADDECGQTQNFTAYCASDCLGLSVLNISNLNCNNQWQV